MFNVCLGWNMTLIFESFCESELNASTHKSSPNMAIIMQADRQTCNSPPHERVDVFFHHAVQRQPHPVPPSVEHVVTSSHQPTAKRTTLTHTGKDREKMFLHLYMLIQGPKTSQTLKVEFSSRSWVVGGVENNGTAASRSLQGGRPRLHRWTDVRLRCISASRAQVQEEEERVQSWAGQHRRCQTPCWGKDGSSEKLYL